MRPAVLFAAVLTIVTGLWAKDNTVLGFSGLLVVPTAEQAADGDLTFGVCRIPKLYAPYYRPYDRTVFFVNLGFTSFLETSFGIVRPDHFHGGVGDRTVAVRLRLITEKKYRPAVAIGMHDFFGLKQLALEPKAAQHFAAFYVNGSKTLQLANFRLGFHLGYAWKDFFPARDQLLDGWFGGITLSPMPEITLLFENDSHRFNVGCRVMVFSRLSYSFALWQMRFPMHALNYTLPLLGNID